MNFSFLRFYTVDYYAHINRFLSLLTILYFYYSFLFFLEDGLSLNSMLFLFTGFAVFTVMLASKARLLSLKLFKFLAVLFILYLNFFLFYIAYLLNFKVNNIYFEFTILSSLPIIFDFETDKVKLAICFLFTIVSFMFTEVIKYYSDLHFKPLDFPINLTVHNLSCIILSGLLIVYNVVFLIQRELHLKNLKEYEPQKDDDSRTDKSYFTSDDFPELIRLAKLNSVLFLEKFESIYPDFFKTEFIDSSILTPSELYLCALTKLGLNTKEIAVLSNSTPKAIDNRKYRIKKKLNHTGKFLDLLPKS